MAEHTPGPWTTRQRVKHSAAIWEVAHPSEQGDIARVALRPKRPEEAEANARLIAAAPLLLEALEELAGLASVRQRPEAQRALQLVAKAKGES